MRTLRYSETITVHYRPGTSDEYVINEVLENHVYRRRKPLFDVAKGEHWLDLGANIGAFALYCRIKEAIATCYEPDKECFEILKLNAPDFMLHNTAVTNSHALQLPFWKGRKADNFSKATAVSSPGLPRHPDGGLPNMHGSSLRNLSFDGVKMDIEGSEGPLIDEWLLPTAPKLCMEYHTSRDPSVENLARRLEILKGKYLTVHYPPEYDRIISASGNDLYHGKQLAFFDRMIFCVGLR